MGSETLEIPIIDFSSQELKPGTHLWNSLKIQVLEVLEGYGCFEAKFDKIIPLQIRKAIFYALPELFDLPLQTKMKNTSKMLFHGYVGQYPDVPLYESMGIDDANVSQSVERFTRIFWPEGKPDCSNTIQSYAVQLGELDQMVRRMVMESLGVEQYTDEHFESTYYLLRVSKYKGPQTNETQLGVSSHTDKNIVTILCQNQVHGLEVQTKDGQWIAVKPSTDSFIVMTGESFHAWTNGRVRSPNHRVMMTGNEARYSVGLFSIPNADYEIKAPAELVDEEHPLLFKPFNLAGFLPFSNSPEGLKAESALKTYCGV